jgi:cytochrome c oxidase cbb3-type subunit 4
MDINDLRSLVTVVSLVLFVAVVLHTWSRRRAGEHEAAAALPFAGDEGPRPETARQGERGE